MTTRILRAALAASLLAGCARAAADPGAQATDAELLHMAVRQLTNVIVYDIFSPPQASRVYSYASAAAYETLRPGFPGYRTLATQANELTAPPAPQPGVEYSFPLASVHAFMTVGRAMTFSRARMDSLSAAMDARFRARGMPEAVYTRSIAYGDTVAKHILAWAAKDRFLQTRGAPKFTITSEPGRWVPTPPAYMDAIEPNWNKLRPFVLDSASQFRPEPPFKFDTTQGSSFFREVREVHDIQSTLTDDQRTFVAFWDCNPYVMHVQGHTMFATKKITPGGHWMGIAGIAAVKARADMMRSAETYARTAMALADGFLSSWDEKFRSNVVRPETVINTYLDEAWEPLLQTPPFPEYTSGHSVISASAAAVLTDQFGDNFAFIDSTETPYGLPIRAFTSFEQAAAEAAASRLYGGIHYRHSVEQGVIQGRQVGEYVVRRIRTRTNPVLAQGSVPAAGEHAPARAAAPAGR